MSDKPSTSQPNTLDNSTDKVTVSVHFYSTVRNTTGISHIEKIVPKKTILRDLLTEIEKELFLPKKSHFLKSDQSDVEPGIICLLDEADIQWIMDDLTARKFSGVYAIQNFRAPDGKDTLGHLTPPTRSLCVSGFDTKSLNVEYRNF